MPEDVTKQPDLMVADPKLNLACGTPKPPVNFTMKHALAAIGFKVSGAGEKITSIVLESHKNGGTLSLDGDSITWTNYTTHSNTSGKEYKAGLIANPYATTATSTLITPANGYLMVPAQTVLAGTKIIIHMDNRTYREFDLSTITQELKAGYKYIYDIKLKDLIEVIDNPYTAENPLIIEGFSNSPTGIGSSTQSTYYPNWLITSKEIKFKIIYKQFYKLKIKSSFNKNSDAFISVSIPNYSPIQQSSYNDLSSNNNLLEKENIDSASIYFNVYRTGPGDQAIDGTLTFTAVNKMTGLDEKSITMPIRIISSCEIGDSRIGNLLVPDRNVGATPKPAVALNYTNYPGDNEWRLPTNNELTQTIYNRMIYSKQRVFIVSDLKNNDKFIGCYFPISSQTSSPNDRDATYIYRGASIYFSPVTRTISYTGAGYGVLRCVKTVQ